MKTYGIPYEIFIFYWSRKENVRYDYYIDYRNLLYDLLFIVIVSFYYYIAFKKIRLPNSSLRDRSTRKKNEEKMND